MSTSTPVLSNHRQTRNDAFVPPTAASQDPQNSHHLNYQSYNTNSQSGVVHSAQPTTPPRTPQKPVDPSAKNAAASSGTESTSKPKARGKTRPKNVVVSPDGSKNDRNTPPLTGIQYVGSTSARPISTPSATAYAGPTFHASPAPSALPIPSFYSKSVSESPSLRALRSQKEESPSNSIDSPTPPTAQTLADQTKREESPLDFFFKADREEKARARSTSSFRGSSLESGPFQPPLDSSYSAYTTPVPGGQRPNRNTYLSSESSSAMFAMELDGNSSPGQPYGPAFSTPYNERINAARVGASPMQPAQAQSEQLQATDRSEALKAYLFSGKANPSTAPITDLTNPLDGSPTAAVKNISRNKTRSTGETRSTGVPTRQTHNSFPFVNDNLGSQNSPRGNVRTSGLRQEVTPTKTPSRTPDRQFGACTDSPTPSRVSKTEQAFDSREDVPSTGHPYPTSNFIIPKSSAPTTDRNADLKGMEDSLRRILKLEPLDDSTTESSIIHTATASVPTYVSSRPSPFNAL